MPDWSYDREEARYYDEESGEYLDWLIALGWLWLALDRTTAITDRLALLLATGVITVDAWEVQMQQVLKEAYIQAHVLGRGGLEQMEPEDWDDVRTSLEGQNVHLAALALLALGLTEAMLAHRSRLFIQSAQQAYWHGHTKGQGWPGLPAYPGDCSTRCCTNCKCYWVVVKVEGGWNAFWELRPAEHCVDCLERNDAWYPLFVAEV